MFVKHYSHNHMLVPNENIIYHLNLNGKSKKRNRTQPIMYGIYSKYIQVIYTLDT